MRPRFTVRVRGIVVALTVVAGAIGAEMALAEPGLKIRLAFHQANEQYRRQHFDEAAQRYQTMLDGGENGTLYYNLGNALLKSGHRGEALWAYLKASAFFPRDADLQANLAYVRELLHMGVEASIAPPRLIRWLTLDQQFATAELATWFGVLLWLAVACWSLAAWIPAVRPALRPVAWLVSGVTVVVLTALLTQTMRIDAVPRAVAIRDRIDARFSPHESGTTYFTLREGTIVRMLGQDGGWVQVERADSRSGWVPAESVKSL